MEFTKKTCFSRKLKSSVLPEAVNTGLNELVSLIRHTKLLQRSPDEHYRSDRGYNKEPVKGSALKLRIVFILMLVITVEQIYSSND